MTPRSPTESGSRTARPLPGRLVVGARARAGDLVQPLRLREVRLLWLAKVSSEVGDWAARLALAYLVLDRTGSAAATAAVTAVSLAPWLGLGQVLATLADRFSHRSVMVVADLVRVVAFVTIAWLPMPLVALFTVVFVAAAASPPFEAARSAALPELAGPGGYGKALMLFNATYQAGLLVGYAAGGGLLAVVGPSWALTVNAGTFVVSVALIVAMRSRTRAVVDTGPTVGQVALMSTRERLVGAATVFARDSLLRRAVLVLVLACAPVMAIEALVVVFAEQYTGGGPGTAGVLSAVMAAGALVAMLALPTRGEHVWLLRLSSLAVVTSLVVSGIFLLTAPGLLLGIVPLALLGALSSLTVPLGTILGERLPRATRATSFSLAQGALMTSQGCGALVAGFLAVSVGVGPAVAIVAVPGLVVAAWVVASTYRRPADNAPVRRAKHLPGTVIDLRQQRPADLLPVDLLPARVEVHTGGAERL